MAPLAVVMVPPLVCCWIARVPALTLVLPL
jgi:hypothetical protein